MKINKLLLFLVCFYRVLNAEDVFTGWLTTETSHFRFYYEESDRAAVSELLSFCDEVYETLTTFLDTKPPGKVECIIRGRTDIANGFTSFVPPKIELYVTSSSDPFLEGARADNWLKYLLTHELTHYIHLYHNKGTTGFTGKLFGKSLGAMITRFFLPGWAVEGITTNAETIYTAGGRGRNPFFEMFYKAPLLEKRLFSLDQAAYSSYFAPRGRIYVAGYILVDYLLKEYGSDFFTRAMQDHSWNPLGWFNANVARLTERDMELVYRNMQADLTLRYSRYFDIPDGIRLSPGEQGQWFLPRVTDKGWYVYRESMDKGNALVRFDPATGTETSLVRVRLTDPFSYTAPADGSVLIFSRIEAESGHPAGLKETADLYEYNVLSAQTRKITEESHLWQPALSANGRRLIAVQRTGSYSRLVEVNRSTGDVQLLFAVEKANVYNPVFSPSGARVAFTMKRQGLQDIYLLNLDEVSPQAGTTLPLNYNADKAEAVMGLDFAGDYFPEFAGEDTLLFSSDRDGSLKLYTVSLGTQAVTTLAEDPVGAWACTRDGSRLIYASYSSQGFCFKTPAGNRELPAPQETPKAQGYPPAPVPDNNVPGEKKALPALMPFFWLPAGNILDLGSALSDYRVYGLGLYTYGGNVFGDMLWQNTLLYYPGYNQAEGSLDFYGDLGKFSYSYSLLQDFNVSPEVRQLTSHSLSAGYLLYEKQDMEYTASLTINTAITHQFILQGADTRVPFGFMNLDNTPGIAPYNYLSLAGGLFFSHIQDSAAADLYGRNTVKWRLDSGIDLPLFSRQITESRLGTAASWCFPLPALHHNMKFGLKAGWQSESAYSRYAVPRMNSLSVYTGTSTPRDISFLLDWEYLYAYPLVDITLCGIPILGAGSALHIEWPWQLNFFQGAHQYQSVYAGAEITLLTSYLPLGSGINVRLNMADLLDFTPADNLSFYLFLGFDSFIGG